MPILCLRIGTGMTTANLVMIDDRCQILFSCNVENGKDDGQKTRKFNLFPLNKKGGANFLICSYLCREAPETTPRCLNFVGASLRFSTCPIP